MEMSSTMASLGSQGQLERRNLSSIRGYLDLPPSIVAATHCSPYLPLIEYSRFEERLCRTLSPQIPNMGT